MRIHTPRSSVGAAFVMVAASACGSADSTGNTAPLDGGVIHDGETRTSARSSTGGSGSGGDGTSSTDQGTSSSAGNSSPGTSSARREDGGRTHDDAATRDDAMKEAPTDGGGLPLDLGTAGNYVILAKTGIATVSPSVITGDLGVSPAAATYITGFSLTLDASRTFSTSAQVTGDIYAADYAAPTRGNLTTAIGDMQTAFTSAAGRAPGVTGLGAGSIGGMTLPAGVYAWSTGLLLATDVTLTGTKNDVWIFQIAKDLTVSDGVHVDLAGGARPKNIFWQVSGKVTLGTTTALQGTVLSQTLIAMKTGASVTGRLLAQTAVTLDANTVVASP